MIFLAIIFLLFNFLKAEITMKKFELHQAECDELLGILKRTIDHGENNSALLIGSRGVGKTYLVNKCLRRLKVYMKSTKCENDFFLVNLSGKTIGYLADFECVLKMIFDVQRMRAHGRQISSG